MMILKPVEPGFDMWYNGRVIKVPAKSLSTLFLLSKINTIAIINKARLVVDTCKSVKTLAGSSTLNGPYFIWPQTTKNTSLRAATHWCFSPFRSVL